MERKVIHGTLIAMLCFTLIGGILLKYKKTNSYEAMIAMHRFEQRMIEVQKSKTLALPKVTKMEIVEIPVATVVVEDTPVIERKPVEENLYHGMTEDELDLLYAVVQQEGGPYYDSAVAVMSTIVNRVNNPNKWGWAGETIIDQITYPMQYCYSLDDYWVQYVGNADEEVKQAVWDVLNYGAVYDYDCFRGYYLEDCEEIYDNWYFIG